MRTALKPKFIPPFRGGVAPDSLLTGLESYWTLDELSGVRADSVGSNDLSDNNTVTYVNDGPRGVNAKFTRVNNEYLEGGKTSLTGNVSISGWVKFSENAVYQCIFANGDGTTRQSELSSVGGINGILASIHTDGVSVEFSVADIRMVDNQWHNILMTYSHTGDRKIRVYIDGELIGTSTATTGNLIDTMNVSRIGGWLFGYTEGNTSRVGVWTKVLSGPEITELYNSGRGKSYSDLSAGIKTNLVSYWNLDEVSDSAGPVTRVDSEGSNDLTDNNTVTSISTGPEAVVANFVSTNNEMLSRAGMVISPNFTWAGWIRKSGVSSDASVFTIGNGWPNNIQFSVRMSNTDIKALVGDGVGFVQSVNTKTMNDGWHFIVFTWSDTTKVINGTMDGSIALVTSAALAGTHYNAASPLGIGSDPGSGGVFPIDGMLARFGLWSRILSAPEITELFNSGRGKSYSDLSAGIKTNLVSYWNLDEVSLGTAPVTRVDSEGSNDLTDNNTVTSINTGPEQVVANFDANNNEFLNRVGFVIVPNGGYTFAGWFQTDNDNVPSFEHVASIANQFVFGYSNGQQMLIYDGGGFSSSGAVAILSSNSWHFGVGWVDESDGKVYYQVDNNTIVSSAYVAPYVVPNGNLFVGQWNAQYLDSPAALLGAWNRVLTPAERTELFNSGVGKKYSELSAGIKTDLVSYWNLTELSGNRADSHGANTLADNNTVLSNINMPDVADKISARFTAATSEYLSRAHPAVNVNGDFTISGWFNHSGNANNVLVARDDGGADRQFLLYLEAPTDLRWYLWDSLAVAKPTGLSLVPANEWHHFICGYNSVDSKGFLYINNGPVLQSAALTGGINQPTVTFDMHALEGGVFANSGSLILDEVAFWNRVLTAPERTRLFNLGKGYFYPFIP